MMCMTELHGGVCHRTSTPHKSGNKMKEKKKKKKSMTHQVRANAPDFIQDHPVQRSPRSPVFLLQTTCWNRWCSRSCNIKNVSKVRDWATIIEDTELLGRLSTGDMVAQDAKYHKKFLSVLHNCVRKAESEGPKYKANEREV